jgi:N-hydroxyarylamine O-acetyltransferase
MVQQYWARLQLDPSALDAKATLDKLCRIHESQLAHIPFENLAQHGGVGGSAVLAQNQTAAKILVRHRGGFCFEVNTLLGTFLAELGYVVKFVPAFVHIGTGYRDSATHVILIVSCQNEEGSTLASSSYFTDVGFGEPPLHPLKYSAFGVEQVTPDGMRSMLVKDEDEVRLEWFVDGAWQPRQKWSYADSLRGVAIADLSQCLADTHHPESVFSKKLIVTLLTRTTKTTLAGNRLKTTGPPRFREGSQGTKDVRTLSSLDEIRHVLLEKFGIPLGETQGIQIDRSLAADEQVWSHL